MKRTSVIGLLALAFITAYARAEHGPSATLRASLGRERISAIIGSEFIEFVLVRAEKPVTTEKQFWSTLIERIEKTTGPTGERADAFLRDGFANFLNGFQEYLLASEKEAASLSFTQRTLSQYLARGCHGSPCKVPPCCGDDGVECWPCK